MIQPPDTATGLERRLFLVLADRFGFQMTRYELIDALYSERDDGGPITVENLIRVIVSRLRKKLAGTPYDIRSSYRLGYALILRGGQGSVDQIMGSSHEI